MNSAAVELFETPLNLGSREIVKEAIKELFQEEPALLQDALQVILSEISGRIDHTQMEQIKDRARIADLELLLGLDEEVQDPEDPYYPEKKERLEELRQKASFIQGIQENPDPEKSVENRLYEELKKNLSMKNRDVMNLFGWDKKNTMKATRLMQKMAETFSDVVYEQVPGKKRVMRIHINR